MEYNGLLEAWANEKDRRKSRRMRWTPVSAYVFSGKEFEEYMILAWRFGFVERSKYKECELRHGVEKSAYELDDEVIRLTREGWEYIDTHDRPLIHRWALNVTENLPTILMSVVIAVLTSWALYSFGAPK